MDSGEDRTAIEKQVAAHGATEADDIARLRSLSMSERGQLLKAACEAAAVIERSRRDAGLPPIQPDPWPESTWKFMTENATRVRS
jgi:hypothetical protein